MKINYPLLWVLFCTLSAWVSFSHGSAMHGKTIQVCDDDAEWPPYSYYQRINGKSLQSAPVVGYAVDVLHAIFKSNKLNYQVTLLPWKRCQQELESGVNYQMALNASYSDERAKKYWLTEPYYSMTSYYFYSKAAHPHGLDIRQLADLRKFRVCGIFGYNYSTYGLKDGEISQQSHDFGSLIKMIQYRRCDLFIEKIELFYGYSAIGRPYLANKDLGYKQLPGLAPTHFYMMIARHPEGNADLLKLINSQLKQMKASGQLKALMAPYLLNPPEN